MIQFSKKGLTAVRDTHLDFNSFFLEIERIAREFSSKVFRSSAPDNSKWLSDPRFENDFVLTSRSLVKLSRLAILSWYVPEEYGILFRLTIREYISLNPDLMILDFLTKSKEEMKVFLYHTTKWHSRDFFGNVLKEGMDLKDIPVRPKMKTRRRPKRVQRHRGYRDKGTLKFSHEIHDLSNRTLEEKELEDERRLYKDVRSFLEGWIT